MLVDYNSESRIFFVVTDSYETVNVPYLLLDRDKKEDVFNENPDSYGYKIFYKRNYKENDIFQVIESDLDKRIGWIFLFHRLFLFRMIMQIIRIIVDMLL